MSPTDALVLLRSVAFCPLSSSMSARALAIALFCCVLPLARARAPALSLTPRFPRALSRSLRSLSHSLSRSLSIALLSRYRSCRSLSLYSLTRARSLSCSLVSPALRLRAFWSSSARHVCSPQSLGCRLADAGTCCGHCFCSLHPVGQRDAGVHQLPAIKSRTTSFQ